MEKDFISGTFTFIEQHIVDIVLVILILFLIISYNIVNNIHFKKSHPVLQRVVVIENMKSTDNYKATCDGDSETKNKRCHALSGKGNCTLADCCVWARKKNAKSWGCLLGAADGPTYDAQKFDEWYYKSAKENKPKRYPLS